MRRSQPCKEPEKEHSRLKKQTQKTLRRECARCSQNWKEAVWLGHNGQKEKWSEIKQTRVWQVPWQGVWILFFLQWGQRQDLTHICKKACCIKWTENRQKWKQGVLVRGFFSIPRLWSRVRRLEWKKGEAVNFGRWWSKRKDQGF